MSGRRRGFFTSANAAQHGRAGGLTTLERHGREHMQRIGRAGFWRTCERHYGGNPRDMVNALINRGLAAIDPFPENGAWQGNGNRLPTDWTPPQSAYTQEVDL